MNLFNFTVIVPCFSIMIVSCSVENAPVDTARSGTYSPSTNDSESGSGRKNNSSNQINDDGGEETDEINDPTDDSNIEEGGGNGAAGLVFFDNQVTEAFKNSCTGCHADPRFMVKVQGPLSIFNYDRMRPLLEDGVGSSNNKLINKVQGILTHAGGDRCLAGLDSSPCKEIVQWWQKEFGSGETEGPAVRVGELISVSDLGRVTGWALDPDSTVTTVKLYANGPKDMGDFITQASANLTGFDGGNGNRHAFATTLPDEYRRGQSFDLYVYGVVDGDEVLLPGSPKTITAYGPSDGGRTFFENTVQPALTGRCGGCHGISYEQQFANLLQPSPAKGGTASNNLLYNKPAGSVGHGGGTFCNGGGSPCAEIRQWWELEFN